MSNFIWWTTNTRKRYSSSFDEKTQMKHKLTSSHPPNVVDTIFLGYFSIRGLLFRTISHHPHWNRRKIEKVVFFYKTSVSHDLQIFSANKGRGGGSIFWNCVNRSIFLRLRNRLRQLARKSNFLIEKIKKIYIYIYKGGAGAPWTFSLPLKNCWYENWWAPPP